MPSSEKISGYQLAEHLLSEGGVGALLRYAGNAETDWLELKAGMCLLPEDRKKGETEKDLYWNIAKEVIALMNTSGGALVIGIHDKTLIHVPLEDNDPYHIIAKEGIDGYIRDMVRSKVWPSNLMWSYFGKPWELTDKQFPADLISYHHPSYTGPDGHSGEVVVLLIKPVEKIRLARKEQKYFALFKRTRGEVGEAQPIYDPEVIDEYKASREIVSERYANIRDQFDADKTATSESATMVAAIKEYYNGLVEKSRRMRAVFTSLDAEENVFSKDDVDQFYSPEAIETFDDEDHWLDDDDENEERERNNQEEDEGFDFEEDSDEDSLDNDDDAEDRYDERTARKGDLLELLKSEHRVIVSGEPGGGKTTCLTYFTLKFAECENECPVLAVFIPMGQWRRGGSLSIMMERATGLDTGQIARLMEANRLRLVIDAVNECPDEFRAAAIQNIGMFLAEHPNIPAVISTRHPKELSALQLPVFHVQPMDEAHRLRYLERYLADAEQAQKLLHQLGGMPGGETVAENPMLLRLVVEVYKESPEKRLPSGRAGLYRRSLRAWYKRENEKAEKAGTKLQWNRRQTFELLAVLAFKSRQRGYRDVPLDEISTIWGKDAENQLEVLCQGPIIYCDDEFVRFRHETFQEYLCAEYLVAHQDELPSWTQADYAQWGMPFAYAVELFELEKQHLPESFWLAAWNLNPWLGVALTEEGRMRQLLRSNYAGLRPIVNGRPLNSQLHVPYLNAVCGYINEKGIKCALIDKENPWYTRGDVALRYVILVLATCQSRWRNFEARQLVCLKGITRKLAIRLAESWLTLSNPRDVFQYHAPEDWDRWIVEATPEKALALVAARIAEPSDFSAVTARWIPFINFRTAMQLHARHIVTLPDLRQKLAEWVPNVSMQEVEEMVATGWGNEPLIRDRVRELVENATMKEVSEMVAMGWGGMPLVREKICKWISTANLYTAYGLVKFGLAAPKDFEGKAADWLREKSILSAKWMMRLGVASEKDFEREIPKWISVATPQMACNLIDLNLAVPSDFSSRLGGWLRCPQYSFVRNFVCKYGDDSWRVPENIRFWIAAASKESAMLLMADGLATLDDFRWTIQNWIDFLGHSKWHVLVDKGFLSESEYDELHGRYLAISSACKEVRTGIKTAQDYAHEIPVWVQNASLASLKEMVNTGLVTREDIGERIKQWIDSATPQSALALVRAGFVDANVFSERWAEWKRMLSPYEAEDFIKENMLSESVFMEMKEIWKDNVSNKTLFYLLKHKCMTESEMLRYTNIWGMSMPENIIRHIEMTKALDKIHVGQIVRGKVKNITDYGAFIDLDGTDGLLHITDLSWGRVKQPRELLKIGQELDVMVINVDRDKERISLGLKQLTENPWDTVLERFPVGSKVKGIVRKLMVYGAFVELDEGVEGLVHISDMSWTRKVTRPEDGLTIGQEVVVVVLNIDPEKQRIALSLKLAQPNPWPEAITKYLMGGKVVGRVTALAKFGAFVELEPGVDGFMDISEISDKEIGDTKEVLSVGDEVTARVIKVDREACRIALSIKALAMTEEELKTLRDNHGVVTQES